MLSNSFEKHRNYGSFCFQWYNEATCAFHASVGHELAEFYAKHNPPRLFPTPSQILTNTWHYLTIHCQLSGHFLSDVRPKTSINYCSTN